MLNKKKHHLNVDPWRVRLRRLVCPQASDDPWEAAVWVSFHEQDESSQWHEHARGDSDGLEKRAPSATSFCGQHRDGEVAIPEMKKSCNGAQTFCRQIILAEYYTSTFSLTDHLQQGGGYQVAIPVSDFVHAIVPWGQPRYDDFIGGAIPAQWDEAPISHVVIRYLALAHQLHGATRGLGIERAKRGFIRVSSWGEYEVGM